MLPYLSGMTAISLSWHYIIRFIDTAVSAAPIYLRVPYKKNDVQLSIQGCTSSHSSVNYTRHKEIKK
jgi:hypothetical protein